MSGWPDTLKSDAIGHVLQRRVVLDKFFSGQGSSAGCEVERAYVEGTYGGYPPDLLYQKLDAHVNMLNEH